MPRWEFTPAEGANDYEVEIDRHDLGPEREAIRIRVRGTCEGCPAADGGTLEAGPWSPYSDVIVVPEPPDWLAIPALILLLLGLKWLSRALGRLP